MKRAIFLLFFTSIVPALFLLVIGLLWANHSLPPPVQVLWDEADDFGWKKIDPNAIQLRNLRAIPYSPYILSQFEIQPKTEENELRSRMIVTLIDRFRQKRILRMEWTNYRPAEFARRRNSVLKIFNLFQIFMEDGEPVLHVNYRDRFSPSWIIALQDNNSKWAPTLSDLFLRDKKKEILFSRQGQMEIDPAEKFSQKKNISNAAPFDLPIEQGLELNEYRYRQGHLEKTFEWPGTARRFIPVREKGYFGYDEQRKTLAFWLRTNPPRIRTVSLSDFYSILPEADRFVIESEPSPSNEPILYDIPQSREHPCLFFCRANHSWLIIEIQDHEIETGTANSIFKIVGRNFQEIPAMAIHGNKALIFSGEIFPEYPEDILYDLTPLALSLRTKNPDESWGNFPTESQEIHFTKPPEYISRFPADAEHLLFYRDQAIWTAKWDGGEEKRIFPK